MPSYPEELITAVKWLIHKGVTRSSDIARRLEVSPYTVSNIKTLLRKRGEYPDTESKRRKKPQPKKRVKKEVKEDFITRMFGGRGKA